MKFRGKLLCGGQVVLGAVAGTIRRRTTAGSVGWAGQMDLIPGEPVGLGGGYELVLDDGRRASIRVTYVSHHSGQASAGYFQVTGALR